MRKPSFALVLYTLLFLPFALKEFLDFMMFFAMGGFILIIPIGIIVGAIFIIKVMAK